MQDVERYFRSTITYLPKEDREVVMRAFHRAVEWHDGQMRDSGESYVLHPIAVATYLSKLEAERDTLVAALIHDVIEDERATADQVRQEFGEEVFKLVDGVTKLSKVDYQGRRSERQIASLRKMLLMASEDLRVIVIKLADRWHNVETLDGVSQEKRERVALETLEIYAPFARMMGLWELKSRFEDVCFPLAYPEESAEWHQALIESRVTLDPERQAFVERVDSETTDGVEASLIRTTDYEMFHKLDRNIDRLHETQQIDSVLLIIRSRKADPLDCYRVLGEIHRRYPISVHAFRDYINAPLPNGYRALHTTVFLSMHHELRIRIQTDQMYRYAVNRKLSSWQSERDNDLSHILASLHRTEFDHDHYLDDLKENVLKERINVFTPAGEIVSLPKGATGMDFAFELNPDHLAYLASVRVNGEGFDVLHELQDGDTVELVLLDRKVDRLQMLVDRVKSGEAKETIRRSLSELPEDRQQQEGRLLIEAECRKRQLPLWWLFHITSIQDRLVRQFQLDSFSVLLTQVGTGYIASSSVAEAYRELLARPSWPKRILMWLRLLPHSRVLNAQATLMRLEVTAEDRKGLIYDITKCIADCNINIAKFQVYAVPPKDALYRFTVEVEDFEAFSDLFDSLLRVPNVKKVLRKK